MWWGWLKHALEWLKASPRYFLPLLLLTAFLLFAPDSTIKPFGLVWVRVEWHSALGLVFLASAAVILSPSIIWLTEWVRGQVSEYTSYRYFVRRLSQLTAAEKAVLKQYLDGDTRTQHFHNEDGVVAGLVKARILEPAVTVADVYQFPINLKLPVWLYLRKHPELLEGAARPKKARERI